MKKFILLVTLLALSFTVSVAHATPVAQAAPPHQGAEGEEYVVQAGDWLSKLAEKYYDDILAYPSIVASTNAKAAEDDSFTLISDPNAIEVGQKLWIAATAEQTLKVAAETAVTDIPLTEPAADRNAEISGMTWYGDYLIMLPQYPNYSTGEGEGFVFAIPKANILAFLDGTSSDPLEPVQIPVATSGLQDSIAGFEGYESIVFVGDKAFLTIESKTDTGMIGYLVSGSIASDLSALTLDTSTLTDIQPQAELSNMSEESTLVAGDTLITFYEANGAGVNAAPVGHIFDSALAPAGTISLANVEYRVTDVTALDENNRFWAMNYFFPGEEFLLPVTDPLTNEYGEGETHIYNAGVERLVEFQYNESGITLAGTAPIQLELLEGDRSLRNWEGLVRLDNRGFLMATDKYPGTILGFAPSADGN